MTQIHPSKLEVTLIDHFSVSFGVEGGSISLVCGMVVVPNLPNLPPLAQWYRDGKTSRLDSVMGLHCHSQLVSSTDKLLEASKLVEMSVGGGAARLTLPHLAKDDEGLYTLRVFTKDGSTEHSAYLFVSGEPDLTPEFSSPSFLPASFLHVLVPLPHRRCPLCSRGPWGTNEREGVRRQLGLRPCCLETTQHRQRGTDQRILCGSVGFSRKYWPADNNMSVC